FESVGYEVKTALDGRIALDTIKNDPPDLITSDVIMPTLNGFEFCDRIKKDKELQHIPVILLTSRDDEANLFYHDFTEPDAYIKKPFDAEELLEIVRKLLG
ncbi:MAG: response regulator, partial [Candidatus Omnitrophica bacterium]|nr:response regulator [Candidatus Omnitrophota bacterium]